MRSDPGFDGRVLRRLLSALSDGHLDAEGGAQLARLLESSASARAFYLRYIDLHLELGQRFEREGAALGADGHRGVGKARPRLLALSAVAAAAAVAALVLSLVRVTGPPPGAEPGRPGLGRGPSAGAPAVPGSPVAVIGHAREVSWNRDDVRAVTGTTLGQGAYAMASGELGLGFINGAEVTIGAPADFVILSAMEIYIAEGRVSARVPPSAQGFTIRSKDMALVDIGTAFSANVRPTGVSRVLVREGEVVASVLGRDGTTLRDFRAPAGVGFEIDAPAADIRTMDMEGEAFVEPFEFRLPGLRLSAGYAEVVRRSGPLAFWRFGAGGGEVVANEGAAPGRHGAEAFGDVRSGGGPENVSALLFAGEERGGFFISDPLPGLNREGYSIEFWMFPRGTTHATVVGIFEPGWSPTAPGAPGHEGPRYLSVVELTGDKPSADGLIQRGRSIRFLHRAPAGSISGVNAFSASAYQPLRWTHVAAVQEPGTLKIYVDGMLDHEVDHFSPSDEASYQLVLGRLRPPAFEGDARAFSGGLDEVAIYDRPLTGAEVAAHFEAATRQPR